ncbi:MAG: amidophosphoribosyltransferase [Planctomycetota bacterium]|jgi:amidophosphoribosyltransferase|nr:amidophosphoribosyltransferase [Planctomycetota bacterium]
MLDGIKDECGIVAAVDLGPEHGHGEANSATRLLPSMLLDIQNRGQLAAGITSYNEERRQILRTHKELGSVSEVFRLSDKHAGRRLLEDLSGSIAIGHTRYSTCGADDVSYAQPLERVHGKLFKWFSFCFNGNVANHRELAAHLADDLGFHLMRPDSDTELFMHYIAFQQRKQKAEDWGTVFRRLGRLVDGAWSMALVTGDGDLLVARDPGGIKPLCYGRLGRYLVFASESIALQNAGVGDIVDVKPGELVHVRKGRIRKVIFSKDKKPAHCFFEWVYFANVASVIDERSVYQARFNMGRALARMEPESVTADHIVVPVPDTSKAAGDAFAFTLGIPSIEGLVRNRYIGRTFIESEDRAAKVRRKFTALRGILEGKKVFLVDDSIVRSTTLAYLIDYIREEGRATEIHVRIACPPIMGPCFYGIDMSSVGELFAPRFLDAPVQRGLLPAKISKKMASQIGADSVQYLPIDELADCIGLPVDHLCLACVNRKYPTKAGQQLYREAAALHKDGKGKGRRITTD